MTEAPQLQVFEPHVGSEFRIAGIGPVVTLQLIEAVALPERKRPLAGRPPFSLLFRGPLDIRLPQQIYECSHEQLGAQAMFLVPVGFDEVGLLYEAVFN